MVHQKTTPNSAIQRYLENSLSGNWTLLNKIRKHETWSKQVIRMNQKQNSYYLIEINTTPNCTDFKATITNQEIFRTHCSQPIWLKIKNKIFLTGKIMRLRIAPNSTLVIF